VIDVQRPAFDASNQARVNAARAASIIGVKTDVALCGSPDRDFLLLKRRRPAGVATGENLD
jgi:hypothetical protein